MRDLTTDQGYDRRGIKVNELHKHWFAWRKVDYIWK